jgi:MFS transporter, YNFM family, putative membrane transport protein
MAFDPRSLAIATAGFAAFVNLYSPQALLPQLAGEFHVGPGEISALMTASTAAVALSAPFTGALADVAGRKRLITAAMFAVVVPTLIMTFAGSVPQLTFWRFVQGLLLPPIFTVAVAYIGDEWPPGEVTRVAGLYISGSAIGGFSGRFIPGLLTDVIGWRSAIQVVALLTLIAAIVVAAMLPRERNFVRSGGGIATSVTQMVRHLRDRRLVATYAIGFGVLFNFVATFTYVNFHLAAPPYGFSPTLLGAVGRPRHCAVRTTPLRPWRHRALGRRRPVTLGAAGCLDCRRADTLCYLRHGVPGGIDWLRHA